MATYSSILTGTIPHRQRSLAGCSPWGCRVWHDWATEQQQQIKKKQKKQGGVVDTVVCNPGGPVGWRLIALAVECWRLIPSPGGREHPHPCLCHPSKWMWTLFNEWFECCTMARLCLSLGQLWGVFRKPSVGLPEVSVLAGRQPTPHSAQPRCSHPQGGVPREDSQQSATHDSSSHHLVPRMQSNRGCLYYI